LLQAFDNSLRRLQTDHIDLYYAHRWDDTTPIEETLRALDDLLRLGKVCYVGASEYASWQLAHANLLAEVRGWTPFVVLQSRYNMLDREVEREVLPYCRAHHVGFIPYHPLAGGFLTGKYRAGQPPPPGSRGARDPGRMQRYLTAPHHATVQALTTWAAARGRGLNELAQVWLLAQPQVCSVISGATRLEHVLDNVKAASWSLSQAELAEVNALLEQGRPQSS
jgi:aryl-alcohol dehydrogenase-like predicted oxidoreductase